jgi:hypothetical protein
MYVCCPFGKNFFCYLPSQRDEVERLQGEVDRHNLDFIRASHTSDGLIFSYDHITSGFQCPSVDRQTRYTAKLPTAQKVAV